MVMTPTTWARHRHLVPRLCGLVGVLFFSHYLIFICSTKMFATSPVGRGNSLRAFPRRQESNKPAMHNVIVNWTLFGQENLNGVDDSSQLKQPDVSIIMVAHNEQDTITETIETVFALSLSRFELVLVLDNCTDKTAEQATRVVEDYQTYWREIETGSHHNIPSQRLARFILVATPAELHVIRAANLGMQIASAPYHILVAAKTRPREMGWDKALLKPFYDFPDENLMVVSGKCAADISVRLLPGPQEKFALEFYRPSGECDDFGISGLLAEKTTASDRRRFSVRHIATQGPIILDATKARNLNWLDETYLSTTWAISDLCLRGAIAAGYGCGHYPVESTQIPSALSSLSTEAEAEADTTASQQFARRHHNYLQDGSKRAGHDMAVELPRDFRGNRTIVTAASQNHFLTMLQLLKTIKKHEPNTSVVVYGLDLPDRAEKVLESWPNVEFRAFNFSRYPDFFRFAGGKAGQFAWKPASVLEVMEDFGGLVLWFDSGDLLQKPLGRTWDDIASSGAYSSVTAGDIKRYTHEGTLKYLNVSQDLLGVPNCNGAIVGLNFHHARSTARIALPWRACAMKEECIAPVGSDLSNHRQDQAVLTVLMRQNSFSCDWANGEEQSYKGAADMDVTIHHDNGPAHEAWKTWNPEDSKTLEEALEIAT